MTIVNVDQVIVDLAGNPVMETENSDLTLKGVCVTSILKLDGEITPAEKMERGRLSMKIWEGGELEFAAEEISLLKKLVGEYISHPLVYMRAVDMLDPKAKD